jgi:hypothetical protein
LLLTRTPSLIRGWREQEDNYEAEEVKEEDPGTRETSAGRLSETGWAKKQTAAGGVGKSLESCEKIGCPRHCVSRKEISAVNSWREATDQC